MFHSRLSNRCSVIIPANIDILRRTIFGFDTLFMLSEAYSFIPYITPSNFANEEVNQLYKQMEQEEQERLLEMDPGRIRISKLKALDRLIMACNRDEESTLVLVNNGIIELCNTLCVQIPLEVWQDDPGRFADADHPGL